MKLALWDLQKQIFSILAAIASCLVISYVLKSYQAYLKFIWHAFIAPLGGTPDQRRRLEKFYKGQADVYDETRKGLLRGRKTMLNLSAAHLRELCASRSKKRLVWVDVGGGTGFNIEAMNKCFPILNFDAVYLVDLCEPLLEVARKRFAHRGWTNVHVLCQDAASFVLPESEWIEGRDPKGSLSFVTFSYSLSMIPNFYLVLDRISYLLSPQDGLLAVVDFYTSGRSSEQSPHGRAIGGTEKECSWLSRWFWQIWFDFDHIFLGLQRRDYLEYKFGTVKSFNGRNRFVLPLIIRIPYYIWLGRSRGTDVSRALHAFEVESGNTIGNTSSKKIRPFEGEQPVRAPEVGLRESALDGTARPSTPAVIDITPPLSPFHYQIKVTWRLPYYEQPIYKEFATFVEDSCTWEDPMEDMKHLNIGRDDSLFVITSAGDHALHYAIAAEPKRIHCADSNPCQGHLFELKLAAIKSLAYSEFFSMFGDGCLPQFRYLLDSKISPFLSSICYQFWCTNVKMFDSSFYLSGYSGWALRFMRRIFRIAGVTEDIKALCKASTIEEQEKMWQKRIRPVLLSWLVVAFMKHPVLFWNALGVSLNQRKMLIDEGEAYDFVKDTLDPIPSTALLRDGAYHYLLTLLGKYTLESCPLFLTREGFDKLRANDGETMDAFRIHTDSVVNVLRGLSENSLTRAAIMDYMDRLSPDSEEPEAVIHQLYRVLAPDRFVLLRSVAKKPWYMGKFVCAGFKVTCISVRQGNKAAIDRVNMHASLWKAHKLLGN